MDTTLLDPRELSNITGIPLGTLAYWRHAGKGPLFLRLGGRVIRYRKSDVDSWIANSVRTSTSELAA
ncbi:helix-turn-helix domain-containing protein [uncultured Bifidobacterium sp.]|uniref:helix-turn-helix transcriptional regulator n=1 Tax=uncultured Bifidobacterium sp. TaxID=165187 RepID=UPI00338F375A